MTKPPYYPRPSNRHDSQQKELWAQLKKDPFVTECPIAPTFYPTKAEFLYPMAYINKIKNEFEHIGMCKIVPPKDYEMDEERLKRKKLIFTTKQQNIHQLQYRDGKIKWNMMMQHKKSEELNLNPPADPSPEQTPEMKGTEKNESKAALVKGFSDFLSSHQMKDEDHQMKDEDYPLIEKESLNAKIKQQSAEKIDAKNPITPPRDEKNLSQTAKRKRCAEITMATSSNSLTVLATPPPRKRRKLFSPYTEVGKMGLKDFGFPRLDHLYNLNTYSTMANEMKEKFFDGVFVEQTQKKRLPRPMLKKMARNPFRRVNDVNYYDNHKDVTYEDAIQEYWKVVERTEPRVNVQYGSDLDADQVGTLFPNSWTHAWNLNGLAIEKDSMLHYLHQKIPGINSPMIYVGMMFSSFCWHTEDNYLPATNFIHYGAPKTWYCIPANASIAFETAMRKELGPMFKTHPNLIHGMITQFSPRLAHKHGIPCYTIKHDPGTFIITLPRVYHAGFNQGFNVAESVNLAPSCWVPYSRIAAQNYRRSYRPTAYSHDKIFLNAMKNLDEFDPGTAKAILTEVKMVLQEETELREAIKKQGIPIEKMLISGRNSTRFCKSVSEADYDFCAVCKQDCFLSTVVCSNCKITKQNEETGRTEIVNRTVCLWHQNDCNCAPHFKKLRVRYTIKELKELYDEGCELFKRIKWNEEEEAKKKKNNKKKKKAGNPAQQQTAAVQAPQQKPVNPALQQQTAVQTPQIMDLTDDSSEPNNPTIPAPPPSTPSEPPSTPPNQTTSPDRIVQKSSSGGMKLTFKLFD